MPYNLVQSQQALLNVFEQCDNTDIRYLDTEFVRERSLFPQFGLLQLSDGENIWLIDPLAVDDLTPLWTWLKNPEQLTIFHAFGEDLELLWHEGKIQFQHILDTQVAAAMLGWGVGLGFAALVAKVCEIELDKSHSRTNWLARPLSEQQLQYAADDVRYLVPVAQTLIAELKRKNLYQACLDECQRLATRKERQLSERYLDVKNGWQLNRQQLAVLRELAAWRYQRAEEKDMALGFVIKDLALIALARYQPDSMTKLKQLNDLAPIEARIHGARLLRVIADAQFIDESDWPEQLYRVIDIPHYKSRSKSLADLCKQQAEKMGIPAAALFSKRQINELLMWHWLGAKDDAKPVLLSGWRGQLLTDPICQWLAKKD